MLAYLEIVSRNIVYKFYHPAKSIKMIKIKNPLIGQRDFNKCLLGFILKS